MERSSCADDPIGSIPLFWALRLLWGIHLQRCKRFRRGPLSDAGELGLGTQSAQEDFEPL